MPGTTAPSAGQCHKNSRTAAVPQLSCELCRERKVKCDKLEPCTNCVQSGVECLPNYRPRLPRGRHSQQKTAKNTPSSRSTHLEPRQSSTALPGVALPMADEADVIAVVAPWKDHDDSGSKTLNTASQNDWSASGHQEAVQQTQGASTALWGLSTSNPATHGLDDNVPPMPHGDLFWADPYEEHETSLPANFPTTHPTPSISQHHAETRPSKPSVSIFRTLCSGPCDRRTSPPLPNQDLSIISSQLCQIYFDQIDPVIKILHRPALRKLLQHGGTYLGYPEGHISVVALSSAVSYAAICSLSEAQCRDLFPTMQAANVIQYRHACETALDRADLLTTGDITVLQAFLLYLVGLRSERQDKVAWSLLPLAVRLAKGMSLHINATAMQMESSTGSFFDQQMRKRLWLTICVLDLQTSFAHNSDPLIPVTEVSGALEGLRHLDDEDFDELTTGEVPEREDLTCATFAFVTYHAQLSGRVLHYASHQQHHREDIELMGSGSSSSRSHSSSVSSLYAPQRDSPPSSFSAMHRNSREQTSAAFDRKAFELIRFCDPETSRQAWFTWHSTQALVASTRLAALRASPSTHSGHGRDNELRLQLAFRVLENVCMMHTDPRCDGLRWYVVIPWHAFAVAITGCYTCSDESVLRQRWPIIEQVWQLHEAQAGCGGGASSCSATLVSPLASLVRKVRKRLGRGGLGDKSANNLVNGGSSRPSKGIVNHRYSPSVLPARSLLSPALTAGCAVPVDYFMPRTTLGGARPNRTLSRGAGISASAPSSSPTDQPAYQNDQRRPPQTWAGSASSVGGGHQATLDATVSSHTNFPLELFSLRGVEDDSLGQSFDDSMSDGVGLQDEDLVAMESFLDGQTL